MAVRKKESGAKIVPPMPVLVEALTGSLRSLAKRSAIDLTISGLEIDGVEWKMSELLDVCEKRAAEAMALPTGQTAEQGSALQTSHLFALKAYRETLQKHGDFFFDLIDSLNGPLKKKERQALLDQASTLLGRAGLLRDLVRSQIRKITGACDCPECSPEK